MRWPFELPTSVLDVNINTRFCYRTSVMSHFLIPILHSQTLLHRIWYIRNFLIQLSNGVQIKDSIRSATEFETKVWKFSISRLKTKSPKSILLWVNDNYFARYIAQAVSRTLLEGIQMLGRKHGITKYKNSPTLIVITQSS